MDISYITSIVRRYYFAQYAIQVNKPLKNFCFRSANSVSTVQYAYGITQVRRKLFDELSSCSVLQWLGCWTRDSQVWFQAITLPGYFWDRWPYLAGKLSWDATTAHVNSALHPSGVAKSSTSFGWGESGKVTAAGWQATLCDPDPYGMWFPVAV